MHCVQESFLPSQFLPAVDRKNAGPNFSPQRTFDLLLTPKREMFTQIIFGTGLSESDGGHRPEIYHFMVFQRNLLTFISIKWPVGHLQPKQFPDRTIGENFVQLVPLSSYHDCSFRVSARKQYLQSFSGVDKQKRACCLWFQPSYLLCPSSCWHHKPASVLFVRVPPNRRPHPIQSVYC